jgi:hypothetical protein
MFDFRFRLYPLGFFTGLFDPDNLTEVIREGCQDGYRVVRREFTFETRRVLLVLMATAFGIMFRRDKNNPEPEYDYRIKIYRTRFFTRTVNVKQLTQVLNEGAAGGYELYYGLKYPTRFLFIFPREAYFFIYRKPYAGEAKQYKYSVLQSPYRFFTRTLDPQRYEKDLNEAGQRGQIKVTFRDEKRILGIFAQRTVVGVFEEKA